MYLSYFIEDVGFLLSNFGIQNLLVFGIQFALQACRIAREERLLSDDALYRAYRSNVQSSVSRPAGTLLNVIDMPLQQPTPAGDGLPT